MERRCGPKEIPTCFFPTDTEFSSLHSWNFCISAKKTPSICIYANNQITAGCFPCRRQNCAINAGKEQENEQLQNKELGAGEMWIN